MRQFLLFTLVGAVAFVVDAATLHLLANVAGANPYLARFVSFGLAVTVTWLLNRQYTFTQRGSSGAIRQWMRYVGSQSAGLAVNYGVFALLVANVPLVTAWPVIGVAAGSACGLIVNFLAAKRYVFKNSSHEEVG